MKWAEIDAAYPAVDFPPTSSSQDPATLRAQTEALLTYFARAALGFPVADLDRAAASTAVTWAYREAFMCFGYGAGGGGSDAEYWRSVCALLCAALGDPDGVALCTGGKTLGAKVQASKVYDVGYHLGGLARHLATAARAKLPATAVEAAMKP